MKEKLQESTTIKALRVKLLMSRINVMKGNIPTELKSDQHLRSEQEHNSLERWVGEFDITGLPLPVKKHIITAGIIQGDIFQYGDGFSSIKEVKTFDGSASSRILYLQVRALTPKSFEMAVSTVETLIDEILDPSKKSPKVLRGGRSWNSVSINEYEIQNLTKPVLSHLITKGIIKGEIFQASGAVVFTKGSPYLANESPLKSPADRPIYLVIKGPDEKASYWAVDCIKKLIHEAEHILTNDVVPVPVESVEATPNVPPVPQPLSNPPASAVTTEASTAAHTEKANLDVIELDDYYPPFMPQLGQTVDADVMRCVTLVHWLLAHPLLVSFMAYPPKGLESKMCSKKLAITALLSLHLYEQYKCSHWKPNQTCKDCFRFFGEAQQAVLQCCETVVHSGYDIAKLMCVDNYIKLLSDDPTQIGVVYDYPLPSNLYYMDNCRLFIDLVVNCGFAMEEASIKAYLLRSTQWYPMKSLQKIVVCSILKSKYPPKNPEIDNYPKYCSVDHHGGLINFQLETISNASPGLLFHADAPKIPRCKYFPFLKRLTIFNNLQDFNKKSTNMQKIQAESSSYAVFQSTHQLNQLNFPFESKQQTQSSLTSEFSTFAPQPAAQQFFGGNVESSKPYQAPTTDNLPSSFTKMNPKHLPSASSVKEKKPLPPTTNPSRLERKKKRKEKLEKKKEKKIKEVAEAIEMLREKYGTDNFWTVNHAELENSKEKLTSFLVPQTDTHNSQVENSQSQSPGLQIMTGSLFSPNLQQAISNLQMSMPIAQSNLLETQPTIATRHESKPIFKPPLHTDQILEIQQPKQEESKLLQESEKQNPLSEVISKLQEYVQASSKESNNLQLATPGGSADPESKPISDLSTESGDTTQESPFSTIIQQLQQLIDSNAKTNVNDDVEDKTSGELTLNEPDESKQSRETPQTKSNITSEAKQEFTKPVKPVQSQQFRETPQTKPNVTFEYKDGFKKPFESVQSRHFRETPHTKSNITSEYKEEFTKPVEPVQSQFREKPQTKPNVPFGYKQEFKTPFESVQSRHSREKPQTKSNITPEYKQEFTKRVEPVQSQQFRETPQTKANVTFGYQEGFKKPFESVQSRHFRETPHTKSNITSEYKEEFTRPVEGGPSEPFRETRYTRFNVPFGYKQEYEKPFEPIQSKHFREMQQTKTNITYGYKQESSLLKRPPPEPPKGLTQPKRMCETATRPSKTNQQDSKTEEETLNQDPSFSMQKSVTPPSSIFSSVSILGDSLLRRARTVFGGSAARDRRTDHFTISELFEDVKRYLLNGGKLNPYCVVMCGVKDIISMAPWVELHRNPSNQTAKKQKDNTSITPEQKEFNKVLKQLVNFLLTKGYYVLLVTLPLKISNVSKINLLMPNINGLIMSYHTKPNLSIIPFHKVYSNQSDICNDNLIKEFHKEGRHAVDNTTVLSDRACELIRDQIEMDFPEFI